MFIAKPNQLLNTDIYQTNLQQMISTHDALMQILIDLRAFNASSFLSAGVIRNFVWSVLHDQDYNISQTEIDVIFYDAQDKLAIKEQNLAGYLRKKFPNNEWDVVNQAFVHTWYKTEDGASIAPLKSIHHALSLWPETATAVAIRLLDNDDFEVIAPFGLEDLFELKLRWNHALVSHAVFMQRVSSKKFLERWERLILI